MTINTRKTACQPDTDAWSDVEDFCDFPILASTRRSFRALLGKASLSFDSLAEIAEQDPAVCLHMLIRIGKRNPSSLDQISTAAGCISLLGMEDVVSLVKQLPVVHEHSALRSERNYVAMLHTAALAGRLAGHWAKLKPGMSQHQAHWAAMLASAPLWPWHLIQVEASQEALHQLAKNKEVIPTLQHCFSNLDKKGLSRWSMLAKKLSLPKPCQSLWQQSIWPNVRPWKTLRKTNLLHIDNNKQLKHQCQQSEMLIYCVNMLAAHYRIGAYRAKSLRWSKITAHLLNLSSETVHQQVINQSLQLAHKGMLLSSINSLLAPSHSSVRYFPAIHCENKPIKMVMERDKPLPKKAASVNREPPAQRKIDQQKMKKLLHRLDEEASSFGDWHTLMRFVLKGITEGIGLSQAYIAVQNKQGDKAKVYYQQGLAETDPLCRLVLDLSKGSIFKRILEKPASLMVTDQNRSKMLKNIPPQQVAALPNEFMMMSLFSGNRPIGIIFADLGTGNQKMPVQPSEYIAFKNLCMHASSSLSKLAEIRKSQSSSDKTNKMRVNRHQA
ncbi:MAG TPA: hypothetical protein DIC30_01420 [Oceanospirillales bacterium]|nr:hypothetical protein [Oleispira sp.]HCM04646.1 hypothetical protein [Oceanospirillales bacterium]|tara:strand:+ start:3165 stop:4829 length:1665 start_codon:yes stop_codon:yes gene_type:complete